LAAGIREATSRPPMEWYPRVKDRRPPP
jgi:hypothetical protein